MTSRTSDFFVENRWGRLITGGAVVGMGVFAIGHVYAQPDDFFASYGWFGPLMVVVAPLFVISGVLLAISKFRRQSWQPEERAKRIGRVALTYLVIGTAASYLWLRPALGSDLLLTGFGSEVSISVGDPVVYQRAGEPTNTFIVGEVASTGDYSQRRSPEYTYVGIDLNGSAPEGIDNAEARIIEDLGETDLKRLMRKAGLRVGPVDGMIALIDG